MDAGSIIDVAPAENNEEFTVFGPFAPAVGSFLIIRSMVSKTSITETGRQAGRQAGKQASKQASKQAGLQASRQTAPAAAAAAVATVAETAAAGSWRPSVNRIRGARVSSELASSENPSDPWPNAVGSMQSEST
jgi:hypothetical protein